MEILPVVCRRTIKLPGSGSETLVCHVAYDFSPLMEVCNLETLVCHVTCDLPGWWRGVIWRRWCVIIGAVLRRNTIYSRLVPCLHCLTWHNLTGAVMITRRTSADIGYLPSRVHWHRTAIDTICDSMRVYDVACMSRGRYIIGFQHFNVVFFGLFSFHFLYIPLIWGLSVKCAYSTYQRSSNEFQT